MSIASTRPSGIKDGAADGLSELDKIQAQVDLSLSLAYESISAKFKPTQVFTAAHAALCPTREEIDSLRRMPPRLGLGAPIPSTVDPATSKLHNTLTGKKRPREGDLGNVLKPNVAKAEEDDDEEDSRAGTISKRTPASNTTDAASGSNLSKKDKFAAPEGRKKKKQKTEHKPDSTAATQPTVTLPKATPKNPFRVSPSAETPFKPVSPPKTPPKVFKPSPASPSSTRKTHSSASPSATRTKLCLTSATVLNLSDAQPDADGAEDSDKQEASAVVGAQGRQQGKRKRKKKKKKKNDTVEPTSNGETQRDITGI